MYHFISGLPRSGSTLLTVILNQNPNFHASISGPLARFCRAVIQESSSQGGYRLQCPVEKREKIIKSIFSSYYDDPKKEVFFDTNRGWTLLIPTIKKVFPNSKIIICVRDIPWILDSFERLFRKNPLSFSNMFSPDEGISVYSRCATLLRSDRTIGFALDGVKQALSGYDQDSIFVLEYDVLASRPQETIKALYKFLNIPLYSGHDFNHVASSFEAFDDDVNLPGLHTTREKVEFIPRKTILPKDIWSRFSSNTFQQAE